MRVGAAGGDVVASLRLIAPEDTGLVKARGARRHVGLHPDDRFDAGRLGGRVELVDAEHVAVVGDRQGGLAQALGLGHVVLDLSGTVQHGVVGVDMKVDEVVLGGCLFLTGRLRHGTILGPRGAPPPGGRQRRCRRETVAMTEQSRFRSAVRVRNPLRVDVVAEPVGMPDRCGITFSPGRGPLSGPRRRGLGREQGLPPLCRLRHDTRNRPGRQARWAARRQCRVASRWWRRRAGNQPGPGRR